MTAHLTSSVVETPFNFKDHTIRTVLIDGNPWFAARDVCAALDIKWHGRVLSPIPEGWQGLRSFLTPSGNQQLRIINEPAVYKLAFRSNKPEADAFTNWVASDVLPALRNQGTFSLRPDGSPEALSTVKDRKPLNALINTWVSLAPLSYRDAWQQVKATFGVENADGLTVSQIKPACEFVQARLDAVMAPAAGKVPQEIVTVIMKASHQNLAYQTTVNRLYLDVCQVLRELDNQLFADWRKLNDCFMSLTGRAVKAA